MVSLRRYLKKTVKIVRPRCNLNRQSILNGILTGELFWVLLCDIHTPDHLKEHFSEFCPIFKNALVSSNDVGPHMRAYAESHNIFRKPVKSLICSYFGEKVFWITPFVRWYLQHGLQVTRIYQFVEYQPSKSFEAFGQSVSDARRAGDADPSKSILAESSKLMGNSSYGKKISGKCKHRVVSYCNDETVNDAINNKRFTQLNLLSNDLYKVKSFKETVKLDLPLQIEFFVYGYAKLRILQFYCDFLDYYLDRKSFALMEMDTDTCYFACATSSLEEAVKIEKCTHFYNNLYLWLPAQSCDEHQHDFIANKVRGLAWSPQPCCLERQRYDKRTLGLFKLEWSGDGMVHLCPKTYFCLSSRDPTVQGHGNKQTSKGLKKRQNRFTFDFYLNVLKKQTDGSGINTAFRVKNNQIYTYAQTRTALSYLYVKHRIYEDGVTTAPLHL